MIKPKSKRFYALSYLIDTDKGATENFCTVVAYDLITAKQILASEIPEAYNIHLTT